MAKANENGRVLERRQAELARRLLMIETRLGILYRPKVSLPKQEQR